MGFDLTADGVRERKLDTLMREQGTAIYRLCCLYLRDMETAKDAAQDVFLKAYRSMSGFRGDSTDKTWLTRIAINTCKDYARMAKKRCAQRSADMLDIVGEPSADDTVIRAVMALPERYRSVVLLRYYQQMPLAQIAKSLGVSVATVSTRLRRAKERLYGELKEWYFDEE